MSAVNSHDSGEESYSMYPKTSSPPLPTQSSMHFPAYQPPVPIYAYPQMPYMYAGQAPGYPFNLMNQNQMLYQGGGMPQQGGGMGSKKKWSNGGSSGGSGSGSTINGGLSSSKINHYHHHHMSPSFHPASISNSSSVSSSGANAQSKVTGPRTDQYKFEISKLSSSNATNVEFPLFFNATSEEFKAAGSKRHELRLKALGIEQGKTQENSKEELTKDEKTTTSLADVATTADVKKEEQKEEPKQKNLSKDSPKPNSTELNTSASSSASTPISATAPAPAPAPASTTTKTPKLWSAVASGGIAKSRSTATSGVNGQGSSTLNGSNQQPQKKDKKYIPPTTKGVETLGSVALRMCFDPDYIDYTLKSVGADKGLCVKSVAPRGIVNRANICFMSSVLQVLLYCRPFINILNVASVRNVVAKAGPIQSKLLDACLNIYRQFDKDTVELERKNTAKNGSANNNNAGNSSNKQSNVVSSISEAIKPDEFYEALSTIPKFKDLKWGHQEDAEEFLTHLLDQLHEEFISSICSLGDNEILNLLQSINDEELRIFFIRNLPRYKKAEFLKSSTGQLKDLISTYGTVSEDNDEEGDGWHEVSGSSKKGKKTKTAAKRTVEMEPSPMSCLFGGQFRSVLDIPNNKESQSITLDPFQTIQLDISDKSVNDLQTAFKKFSEYELLPFKSSSGYDVEAKKQTFIDRLPQVLLIQLKRFQYINNTEKDNSMVNYNAYNGRIEKIRKKINYEHELIIPIESISSPSAYKDENRRYHLTGVIYHHGVSSDGGHYTADVYHRETDKWYRIDDVNIIELKKEDVLKGGEESGDSRTAYILMYQKV
ncbi:hypothetical protein ZYGR_0AG04630 [Zygosaccharomyces rouxii]|uniref:Ubiquitin carboxyl-terminal hydrolase n=1 Tax=Zygosaccharomyces rouxii TaxID=4956 RepID=A0A1Q3A9T5_ZYGRO|nr:hypothetical protein ZYGR_0AG04630 [Zygosaccharomyces rouxii]